MNLKMSPIRLSVLFMAAAALLHSTGCVKSSGNDTPPDPVPRLELSQYYGSMTFSDDGKRLYVDETEIQPVFAGTTNQPSWKVELSPDESWCSATVTEEGFTLCAESNLSVSSPQTVTATVTAGEALPLSFTVVQKGASYDIYIAGMEYGEDIWNVAKYWKNGVGTSLSEGEESCDVFAIAGDNNGDIYIVGHKE